MSRATRAISAAVGQAHSVLDLDTPAGRRAARNLSRLLNTADSSLSERLLSEAERYGGAEARFSGAALVSYQTQVRATLRYVEARLGGLTHTAALAAVEASTTHAAATLERLERAFRGVTTTPIRVSAAVMMDPSSGFGSSLLRSVQTSAHRYGSAMIEQFEAHMRAGMVTGLDQRQMVELLTGHGGPTGVVSMRARYAAGVVTVTHTEDIPEGLFRRYRWWAQRIVRTETARAYNAAQLETYRQMRRDFPDLQKKILATFDNRTAMDSVLVHGQVRDLDGYFQDGAGRVYQAPPARPNDRETVIPWRGSYTEEADTRSLSPVEVERAAARIRESRPVRVPRTRPRPATPARLSG